MNKILIIAALFMSFGLQAKIITKAEVSRKFMMGLRNCGCALDNYFLEESSVDISLSENIGAQLTDFFGSMTSDFDVYEIHADFYKDGDRYHLNYLAYVTYFGTNSKGRHSYQLETVPAYNFPFWEAESGEDVQGKVTFKYNWTREKAYY